jgi:hypothetical protein
LKTRLNLLNTGRAWWTLLVLILLASIAKIVPVTIATKICTRKSWSYCGSMGVLMNTRGIVQLVVLNIGVQLKVISPFIFAMFVLMATILTFLTSPILLILYQRNSAPKVLEESKTAHVLHLALKEGTNPEKTKEDIVTISTGENRIIPLRQMSNASSRPNLSVSMNGENDQLTIRPRSQRRMTLF